MKAEDTDATKRWRSISEWYAEFAATPGWHFLTPMVGLTAWVADQPFAAPLFPATSHECLCVSMHKGYEPKLPFFSCRARTDPQFEFEFWDKVGHGRGQRLAPLERSREMFREFVALLEDSFARSRLAELAAMVDLDGFRRRFPTARLLATLAEVESARVGLPANLLPFMREDHDQTLSDVYSFDLSDAASSRVVVWTDHAIVNDWSTFAEFLNWLRDFCAEDPRS